LLYVTWVWLEVGSLSAAATKVQALRENPDRTTTEILLLGASLASLIGVGLLIVEANTSHGTTRALEILLGLASVVVAWSVVHTTYALRYARLYYGHPRRR